MGDKGSMMMEELLDAVQDAGWEVINVGTRYRVTNPKGGKPAFIPHRLPKNGQYSKIVDGLSKAGFDFTEAERRIEEKRQERLKADRELGAHRLAEAERLAAAREARPTPPKWRPEPAPAPVPTPTEQFSEILMLTPDLAASLLRANRFYEEGAERAGKCNRRFRPWLAKEYAETMLRGEWLLNHQGIGFDTDPTLIDGQHRLAAVVIAGETKPDFVLPMQVTYGIAPEAMDAVDIGLKRSAADTLSMHGEESSTLLSATLRMIHVYDTLVRPFGHDVPFAENDWRSRTGKNITYGQTRAMLEAEPEVRDAVRYGGLMRHLILPSAACAGVHILRREWPAEVTEPFLHSLRHGTDLTVGTGVWALREAYVTQRTARNYKRTPHGQLALFIKGWNLHVTGKERTRLVWRVDEPFPFLLTPSALSSRRREGSGSSDQ